MLCKPSCHNPFTSGVLLKHYLHWAGLAQGQRENMRIPALWELTGWKGKREQGMTRRHCIHMADNQDCPAGGLGPQRVELL